MSDKLQLSTIYKKEITLLKQVSKTDSGVGPITTNGQIKHCIYMCIAILFMYIFFLPTWWEKRGKFGHMTARKRTQRSASGWKSLFYTSTHVIFYKSHITIRQLLAIQNVQTENKCIVYFLI